MTCDVALEKAKVGVVLLNWNGGEFTIPCISSLLAGDLSPWRILVFDNASTDGSPEEITAMFPEVQMVRSAENVGFAAGSNQGIRQLLAQGADFLWILNNDTVVHRSCLRMLVEECLHDGKLGGATGKIFFQQPGDRIWYAGGRWNRWSFTSAHRGRGEKDTGQYDRAEDVEFASGCCMLLRREALARVGLFDERYFVYCEDAEWCLRARRHGVRMRYVPHAVLWHRVSASAKKNAGGKTPPLSHYYNQRNRLFNMRRYAGRPLQVTTAVLAHLARALPLSVALLVLRRWATLKSVVRGIRDGLLAPV